MATKDEQRSKARSNARKAAEAANTAKQAVKAGSRIAAGDVVGGVKEILKDKNMRGIVLAVAIFLICIPIMLFSLVPNILFYPSESAYEQNSDKVNITISDITSGTLLSDIISRAISNGEVGETIEIK